MSWRTTRSGMAGATIVAMFISFFAAMPTIVQAAPVINDPPVLPHNITIFPERDFIVVEGFTANAAVMMRVLRNGVVIATATGTTDGTGFLEVNHPGGVCWTGSTPNILPGDAVEVVDVNGNGDRTHTGYITATAAQDIAGQIVVHGTAQTPAGAPLPLNLVEQRIVNPDFLNTEVGRRDIRAPGSGTLAYDPVDAVTNPAGINWTATYSGLSSNARAAAVAGQTRVLSWQALVGADRIGITIFEVGELGGPGFGGCPASANYAITSSNHPAVNIATVGTDLVLSGVAQDTASVTVTLDDSNAATTTLTQTTTPTPTSGAQTFTVTFPATQVAGLSDGTLTATGAYSLTAGGTLSGVNLSLLKDIVAPTVDADLASGLYNTPRAVTLTASESATIRYVLNGASDPTPTSGTIYTGPVNISTNGTTVLKFIAVDTAGNPSALVTRTYQLDTIAPSVSASPPGGAYRSSQSVSLAASETAQIFYTLDGSTPTTASTSFTGTPIAIAAGGTTVLKLIAVDTAGNSSPVVTETYRFEVLLAVTVSGTGSVTPIGNTVHGIGSTATLTATAGPGHVFTGWTVDGVFRGWANPLTLTMGADHTVLATFAARPGFPDVAAGHPAHEAIGQLAARGIVRGYANGAFGPGDATLRAQMAALIVRAMGWGGQTASNPFPDRSGVDAELWQAVAILNAHGVARGFPDGTYRPINDVLYAQTVSFITRAMVNQGYWQPQPDNALHFRNVPEASGHRQDLATYLHYVGSLPGLADATTWATWDQPSTRAWFAQTLWAALESHFGVDRVP